MVSHHRSLDGFAFKSGHAILNHRQAAQSITVIPACKLVFLGFLKLLLKINLLKR